MSEKEKSDFTPRIVEERLHAVSKGVSTGNIYPQAATKRLTGVKDHAFLLQVAGHDVGKKLDVVSELSTSTKEVEPRLGKISKFSTFTRRRLVKKNSPHQYRRGEFLYN